MTRRTWMVLFIIVLTAAFLGPSFAARSPNRSGLYMWSAETGQYVQVDRVLEGLKQAHSTLFRQVFSLEQRIKALERD